MRKIGIIKGTLKKNTKKPPASLCYTLGPTLANIFVGFYEEKLFNDVMTKPLLYCRYVNDFQYSGRGNEFPQFVESSAPLVEVYYGV